MTFDEFETAQDVDLTNAAKYCFDVYNNETFAYPKRSAALLEAQFYMQELGRREDASIATRDLWLEIVVILLIGIEIILSIYGIRLAVRQGNDADALMSKQTAILNRLDSNMQMTAQTLQTSLTTMQSMNTRLGTQLGRTSHLEVDFTFDRTNRMLAIANRGNVNLELWGYKIGDGPKRLFKAATPLKGSDVIRVTASFYNDFVKAMDSSAAPTPAYIYLRDDIGNDFVGTVTVYGAPNITGTGGTFNIVQGEWLSK